MKATDRSTDAWFLNEDLGVYRYSRARQQDDFPNDPPTAYDTKAEAEAAADAMARQEGVTMKATATYTGPAGTTTATVETTSRDVLAHRLVRGALNAACPGLAYTVSEAKGLTASIRAAGGHLQVNDHTTLTLEEDGTATEVARRRERCDAETRLGTGTGTCDAILDDHGNCPRFGLHVGS